MGYFRVLYTALRVVAALFLLTAAILEIVINTTPLATSTVTVVMESFMDISTMESYYLWYLQFNVNAHDRKSYSPPSIVACRALLIIALVSSVISLGVATHGIVHHWGQSVVTPRTNVLLYTCITLSCVALMVLVGFTICFNAFFRYSNKIAPDSSGPLQIHVTLSWSVGLKCAVVATVFCFMSTILDCIVLRLSNKMEMVEALPHEGRNDEQHWEQQQPPQTGLSYEQGSWSYERPMNEQLEPAYGEQLDQPPPQASYGESVGRQVEPTDRDELDQPPPQVAPSYEQSVGQQSEKVDGDELQQPAPPPPGGTTSKSEEYDDIPPAGE